MSDVQTGAGVPGSGQDEKALAVLSGNKAPDSASFDETSFAVARDYFTAEAAATQPLDPAAQARIMAKLAAGGAF